MQIARIAAGFTDSIIRDMTRQIALYHPHDGINLAQGFPDFAAPEEVKRAACEAIMADLNQYAITWGAPLLRQAIADRTSEAWGREIDPDREVTVCAGSTEAMFVAIMATVNPGDEVVIFAPFYENYWPDTILAGATPRFVYLHPPDWHINRDELRRAFGPRTRGIVVNTPHNPTGKVYSQDELLFIAQLCHEYNAWCYTDEIYEHLVYDGRHIPPATLPGMAERTISISGLSKTFSVTGWRLGYAVAPPRVTLAMRKVHDYVTCGAAHPLQAAGAAALRLGPEYFETLRREYQERRDFIVGALHEAGFRCDLPAGAYYAMTDASRVLEGLGLDDDRQLSDYLVREIGLATVPGSSFYPDSGEHGRREVRFVFCKKMETLRQAVPLLQRLRERVA